MQIPVSEAKAQFAELLRRAEAGEAVTITRHGKPVVELRAAPRGRPAAFLGAFRGKLTPPDDQNEGDDKVRALFEAGDTDPAR